MFICRFVTYIIPDNLDLDLRTLRAIRVLRPLKLVSGIPSKSFTKDFWGFRPSVRPPARPCQRLLRERRQNVLETISVTRLNSPEIPSLFSDVFLVSLEPHSRFISWPSSCHRPTTSLLPTEILREAVTAAAAAAATLALSTEMVFNVVARMNFWLSVFLPNHRLRPTGFLL